MNSYQYFDLGELRHDSEEIFVDVGAYDGLTSRQFIEWAKGKYKYVYVIEPNKYMKEIIHTNLYPYSRWELISKGLSDCEGRYEFTVDKDAMTGAHFSGEGSGGEDVSTVLLDDILGNEKITFIKMDIEGYELRALHGCKHIIKKYRPKLAICIYHKLEDLWEIPQFILECNPAYKFYVRCYALTSAETVLYAI